MSDLENKSNNDILFEIKQMEADLFDFYLPYFNTCIEFNGRQHYEPVKYWGGMENFKKQQKRDYIKKEYCENKNITLIIINDVKEIKTKLVWMMKI
jgi:hypothetical protein